MSGSVSADAGEVHLSRRGPSLRGPGQGEGAHPVYSGVDEMLSPETLGALVGRPISSVKLVPFGSSDGKSGSQFSSVDVDGEGLYILKRVSREWDWVMRVTDDRRCRAVWAWQSGLLDRVPPAIEHGTVACARDGDGWAILMGDFRDVMIPPGNHLIAEDENALALESMADLHAGFWGETMPIGTDDEYCSLSRRYACFSPTIIGPEAGGPDLPPRLALEGWNLFPALVDSAAASVIGALLENVRPLADALSRYPQTLVHGDWKLGNVGVIRPLPGAATGAAQPRVLLLDWAIVGRAPPAADLAWYLALNSARLPISKEACIAAYRGALARRLGERFDEDWWLPQLELCLLGTFALFGWEKALGASRGSRAVQARERTELAWWSQQALVGARWL